MVRNEHSDNKRGGRRQANSEKSEIGHRILIALYSLDKDVAWLSGASGVALSTIYDTIRRGFGKPDHAIAVAKALGVSLDWLLTGEGVDPAGNDTRREMPFDHEQLVEVPEIDPSFGLGSVFMDEAPAPEMRTFSRAWLRQLTTTPPEELYWARGRGNSMSPTIQEGEPVLVDRRQQSPRDADLIWAFAWGDIGAIKRLRPMPDGSVKILSDNPAVPPDIAHGSEIHIFGRVVAVVKNL